MKNEPTVSRPVRIVVIGAGNRANKYLEYARRYPDRLQPVAVVDVNDLRRHAFARDFGLPACRSYAHYDDFFADGVEADMVLISTPENVHFDPAVKAIDAGYHILLEKPIAQHLEECREIARRARERGVMVGVCHVLRYHPYFAKIREIVASGELGQVVSVNHTAAVGLDRATHSYVRGIFRRERESNPILLAKCCHDIDFLLWLTGAHCRSLSSFGSLRWFRAENAPAGAGRRCLDCAIESACPFSARDLYYVRRDWVANFDVPEGKTLDETILEELRTGIYGRCVYHCDNDVVDHQRLVKIELAAANKKFRMFAGPHEGAGIIQEEVVEAVQEMNGLRQELNAMWMNVYSINPQISTKGVYDRAVALAVEAIQTAAMARKFERSQRRHWPGAKEPHYDEEEK